MKKIIIPLISIMFAISVLINIFLFKTDFLDKCLKHYKYYSEKTVVLPEAEEIHYNEDYAINVAIIVYKQLYKKEYSADDFIVDDNGRFGSLYWHVRIDVLKAGKQFNGVIDERPKGLVIAKNNGAIVINLGE